MYGTYELEVPRAMWVATCCVRWEPQACAGTGSYRPKLNGHSQHAARHRGVANPPEEGQPAVGEQRHGYELGWLGRPEERVANRGAQLRRSVRLGHGGLRVGS